MKEKIINNNGLHICTESFGNPASPALLLIMGATASMVWWEDDFCLRLADEGRYVIRYDNRDVGCSISYPLGEPGYTFEDMADDAIHVLDAYGINQAHIAGMSMGGMITQIIALRHPQRVLSTTLISTSNYAPELPPMDEEVMSFFTNIGAVDWENEQSVISYTIAKWRILTGPKYPFDEERITRLATIEAKRAVNLASMNNHSFVTGGETYLERTKEINLPTLVIHGTEDPINPYKHGVYLAKIIPNAAFLSLEGTGHELPPGDWDLVINAISSHTAESGRIS
ncbi:MAG: alpha/beta hydrolase [Candidatus Cohnella colombiensis]|uniref:Alpha/beta hydrolase n=1 Tax=Candidatus Cohnella colombiensis TaxID=3121368 RepID=A0AA95EUT1_9BACL|nr:MAG: alpha/beta hydrolase [Cohnella sp.]